MRILLILLTAVACSCGSKTSEKNQPKQSTRDKRSIVLNPLLASVFHSTHPGSSLQAKFLQAPGIGNPAWYTEDSTLANNYRTYSKVFSTPRNTFASHDNFYRREPNLETNNVQVIANDPAEPYILVANTNTDKIPSEDCDVPSQFAPSAHSQAPESLEYEQEYNSHLRHQNLFEYVQTHRELLPAVLPFFYGLILPKPWRSPVPFRPYANSRQKKSLISVPSDETAQPHTLKHKSFNSRLTNTNNTLASPSQTASTIFVSAKDDTTLENISPGVDSSNVFKPQKKRSKRSLFSSPIFQSVFNNPDPSKSFTQRFFEGSRKGESSNLFRKEYFSIGRRLPHRIALSPPKTRFAGNFRKHVKLSTPPMMIQRKSGMPRPVKMIRFNYGVPANTRAIGSPIALPSVEPVRFSYGFPTNTRPAVSPRVPSSVDSRRIFEYNKQRYLVPGIKMPRITYEGRRTNIQHVLSQIIPQTGPTRLPSPKPFRVARSIQPLSNKIVSTYRVPIHPKPIARFISSGNNLLKMNPTKPFARRYNRSKRSLYSNPIFDSVFNNHGESLQQKFFDGSHEGDISSLVLGLPICDEHNDFHEHGDYSDKDFDNDYEPLSQYGVPVEKQYELAVPGVKKFNSFGTTKQTSSVKPAPGPFRQVPKVTINYGVPVYVTSDFPFFLNGPVHNLPKYVADFVLPKTTVAKPFKSYVPLNFHSKLPSVTKSKVFIKSNQKPIIENIINNLLLPSSKRPQYFQKHNIYNTHNETYLAQTTSPVTTFSYKTVPATTFLNSSPKTSSVLDTPKNKTPKPFLDINSNNIRPFPVIVTQKFTNGPVLNSANINVLNPPKSHTPTFNSVPKPQNTSSLNQKSNVLPQLQIPKQNKSTLFIPSSLIQSRSPVPIFSYKTDPTNSSPKTSTVLDTPKDKTPKPFLEINSDNIRPFPTFVPQKFTNVPVLSPANINVLNPPNLQTPSTFNIIPKPQNTPSLNQKSNVHNVNTSQVSFSYNINLPKENISQRFKNYTAISPPQTLKNISPPEVGFLNVPKSNPKKITFNIEQSKVNTTHLEPVETNSLPLPGLVTVQNLPKALEDNIKYNSQFVFVKSKSENEKRHFDTVAPNLPKIGVPNTFVSSAVQGHVEENVKNTLKQLQNNSVVNKGDGNQKVVSKLNISNNKPTGLSLPNTLKIYMFRENAMSMTNLNSVMLNQGHIPFISSTLPEKLNPITQFSHNKDTTNDLDLGNKNVQTNKQKQKVNNLVVLKLKNRNTKPIGLSLPKILKRYMFRENAMIMTNLDFDPQNNNVQRNNLKLPVKKPSTIFLNNTHNIGNHKNNLQGFVASSSELLKQNVPSNNKNEKQNQDNPLAQEDEKIVEKHVVPKNISSKTDRKNLISSFLKNRLSILNHRPIKSEQNIAPTNRSDIPVEGNVEKPDNESAPVLNKNKLRAPHIIPNKTFTKSVVNVRKNVNNLYNISNSTRYIIRNRTSGLRTRKRSSTTVSPLHTIEASTGTVSNVNGSDQDLAVSDNIANKPQRKKVLLKIIKRPVGGRKNIVTELLNKERSDKIHEDTIIYEKPK